MATDKQIKANRRNAQNSTGPRTAEAKAKSSQNALTHGLTARNPVLPDENPEAYAVHQLRIARELKPVSYFEEWLVGQIADLTWRLRRVPGLEAAVIRAALDGQVETETWIAGTRRQQITDIQILQKFDTEQEKRAKRQTVSLRVGKAFSSSLQNIDRLTAIETRMHRELGKYLVELRTEQEKRQKDKAASQTIIDLEVEESGGRKSAKPPSTMVNGEFDQAMSSISQPNKGPQGTRANHP